MGTATDSVITRRGLLRIGALVGVGAAVLRSLHLDEAGAVTKPPCVPCNPERPETPSGALEALMTGNANWASGNQKHPGEGSARRSCSANVKCPQTPFAAILSCVDSRVPPELLFDQGIGDLFIARVAGNSVVEILQDSLRYGTENLGALVLFVLGHSDCGAVTASVRSFINSEPPEFAFEVPIYPAVAAARKIVRRQGGNPDDPAQVTPVAIDQHVILTVQQLATTDPFRSLVKDGELLIKGGRYDLDTQIVTILI